MLFVSVKSILEAELMQEKADGIEFRLDLFAESERSKPLPSLTIPQILTWKEERQTPNILRKNDKNTYFDPPFPIPELKNYIFSKHIYDHTPEDIDEVFHQMVQTEADIYKIASFANSTLDALRMLIFLRKKSLGGKKLIALCMGEKGQISRILTPLAGGFITFASLDEHSKTAPGQLSIDELISTYYYKTLNKQTAPYGLIGDPIEQSIGHIVHNRWFQEAKVNAVYVKMAIKESELKDFFKLASDFGFQGLSVTMPLKEAVIPYLDEIDQEANFIGAVNTIKWTNGKTKGFNTDGLGALNAIEKHLQVAGKKVLVMGAGGAAKAIVFEAKKRGAEVSVLGRNALRGEALGKKLNAPFILLNDIQELPPYDILINCIPNPHPIAADWLKPGTFYMDIQMKSGEHSLLKEAKKLGLNIIEGVEMFMEQALLQQKIWKNDQWILIFCS